MKAIIQRFAQGATRLLVLAFGLGLVSTGWATAPTPTAVWQSGEFETAKGGYTISLNGNSVDATSGNLVIGAYDANNHLGATIDLSGANATAVSILIKYAELPAASTTHINMSSVADSEGKEFGAYITETGTQRMATFLKNESTDNYHYSQTAPTMIMASGSGYFLLTYGTATGTFAYSANNIKALSGNGNGSAKGSSAISAISIGGPVTYIDHHTSGNAWPGAVIEKVVLFVGKQCSVDEIQQYCGYTADLVSELLPWRYNENCNIYAWREDYNSTKAYDQAKFSSVGSDGSFGTAATVSYTQFGNSRPQPGHVLYYDKSGYQPSSDAQFNPFAIGGLLVRARGRDNANYSIVGNNAGKRSTYLGYSNYTTYWTFDEGFAFNRTSDLMIYGTANVEVAAGKIFDCNSSQTTYKTSLGSNARLVLSGEGNMKVTTLDATNGGIDFSALRTRTAESTFITGTLNVGANTALVFPEGTDLSAGYPVATSVTGTLPGTFKIGDMTYEDTLTTTDGKIYSSSLLFATIDSTDATTFAAKFPSASGSSDCTLRVSESATMSVGSATTVGTLRIHVEAGKTLTLSGNALTATTIYITGQGMVKTAVAGALKGTLKGDGVLQYNGVLPTITSGISFSNSDWTGTMWLKDFGSLSSGKVNNNLTADMANWGNSGSKVKFTNVKAYAPNSGITCNYTLVLEDGAGSEEYAWRCDNGYSSNSVVFDGLAGSGTFYDGGEVTSPFKFNNYNNFTGVFNISAAGHRIGLSANCNGTGGTIAIGPGVTVNFEEGKVWTAGGGFVVNAGATLNVNADATVKFESSQKMLGTLNIAKGKTLTAASSDAVSHNTGSSTVNVYGTLNFDTFRWTIGPNTVVNLYEGAIVQGTGDSNNSNAAMDFNVSGGSTIHAIGNATVSCTIRNVYADGTAKINVDEGKTLTFSGNLVGSYGFKKQGAGVLKLTGTVEKFPAIEAGTVLLGGNKAWDLGTLRDLTGYTLEEGSSIAITQTKAEYGSGVTTVTGVDSSIASITVNKPDGTTGTITPASGTGMLSETAVVSGSAVCNHDYEFDNAWTDAGSDQKDAKTWDSADPNFLQDGETSNWSVYTAVCPGNENTFNLSGDWSAAIRCTVPQKANGVIVAFGNNTSFVALAAGATENTARLVKGGGDGAATELATMSVAHATTAMHVYAFVKTANAVDIYCDGARVTRYNGAIGNLSDGFQFGTVRSVSGNVLPAAWGIVRLNNSEKDTGGNVDYMRIYNFAITSEMIAKLHTDHPYVSPSTTFTRTLGGESGLEWSAADAWTKGGETAAAPDADGKVELTASADSTIAANLSEAALYETLTFKGAGAITVTKATGGATLSAVEVAVDTDTTVAADAVDFTVSRVAVAAGKTLTFDVSGIASANGNWANAASVERIRLTGLATLGASATVAVTPTTAGYWNLSAVGDGGYWYLSVAPGRANGDIYWQSGTYWNSTYNLSTDSPAVFTTDAAGQNATKYFAGDTVVIPTTTKRYFGPISDGAAIKFDCGAAIEVTKTDSLGYVFKNATVTVASGTTLNFVNSWNGVSPEVYGGTISGAGKVKVESGKTLTLSNGATLASETALTGAGEVVLASVPTAQMTFDNWTGTVVLPAITSHVDLTLYGNSDSTIGITSLNTYLTSPHTEIGSTLRLDGAMTISAFSDRNYSFTKITGNGNLTFPNSNSPTSIKITELANYTGTLINNHESVGVAVTRVTKSVDVDGGALLLATNGVGEVSVSSFEVAGVAVSHYVAAGGFYRGAARYDGTVYKTFAEAINAVEEDGALLSDITVLDGSATVPDGYYIDNGVVAKCPAAIVYAEDEPDYYSTVQAAVNAANAKTYAGDPYEYVAVYANAAVTTTMTLKIKPMNEAVVTVSVPDITSEYALKDETDGNGVVTYTIDPASTDYTWVTGSGVWDTTVVAPWCYDVESTPNPATRAPGSVDSVAFASAADVTVGANVSVSSMTVSSAITLTKSTADVTVTATTGGIVLTDAGASITVSGVTLSPAPTTTVAKSYVKFNEETSTYSVKYMGVRIIAR